MSTYLLEVGTEELPYKFIPQAMNQLNKNFKSFLEDKKIKYSDIKVYATPRRLAVLIYGLGKKTADEEKIIKGPISSIAFDKDGNLTKAGEGFIKKNNLTKEDLYVENNYVYARIVTKGKSIKDLLAENVASVFMKLQGAHFMRWGYNDEKFSRPIKWVVSVLDDKAVKINIIDKKSGTKTRGHRFFEQETEIRPENYLETLRKLYVIADPQERKDIIVRSANEAAAKIGAVPYYTDDLLEEVTFITEYPVPVMCEFSKEYLKIPQEVTVTVMAVHQRYFALHKNGKLINKFITMADYIGDEFENIKAGNVRVIKARLDDAVFFFNEDTRKPLESYVEALKGVTFQKGMGTMYDKTQRIISLSKKIAQNAGIEYVTDIERTAQLCKADLTTNLVVEFTELQGFIGADYAKVSGENKNVVQGIKEHYFPLNADGKTAKGIEGQIVGIADKIDTVCAVFASGKKPTGSSDPLGVRRAALGVIRTVLNAGLKIDISQCINAALKALPVQRDCTDEINEFFIQRLFIFLEEKKKYSKNVLEACAAGKNPLADLNDYAAKVKIISSFKNQKFLDAAKRVSRILKEKSDSKINKNLLEMTAEKKLYKTILSIQTINRYDSIANKYRAYLNELVKTTPVVENFFNDVLVMDKNKKVKQNRISLLSELKGKYDYIADFSKL